MSKSKTCSGCKHPAHPKWVCRVTTQFSSWAGRQWQCGCAVGVIKKTGR